jgi:two-component system, NarL family, invasion response regulator UvrY
MHDDPVFGMRALEAGADGYVSKNAPPAQILEAMQRLAAGQSYVGPELAQQLAMWNALARTYPLKDLSRRDLQILRLLGNGQACSKSPTGLASATKPSPTTAVRSREARRQTHSRVDPFCGTDTGFRRLSPAISRHRR